MVKATILVLPMALTLFAAREADFEVAQALEQPQREAPIFAKKIERLRCRCCSVLFAQMTALARWGLRREATGLVLGDCLAQGLLEGSGLDVEQLHAG
jgi:hypothetical protein